MPQPQDLHVRLPDPTDAPRCSDFTRDAGADPGGTAIAAEALILVDTPLPWPKPVFDHGWLQGVESMTPFGSGQARVLATVPRPGGPPVTHVYWREGGRTRGVVAETPASGDAQRLIGAVDGQGAAALDGLEPAPERAVLICTQGSHDFCCGTRGTRLAQALGEHPRGDDITVFRVSHTGGHRFAPTAMTLPDGRMWAYLDLDLLFGILDRALDPVTAARHCRGWWGAGQGPPQVAERAVFAEVGWHLDDTHRQVVCRPGPAADAPAADGPATDGPASTVCTVTARGDGSSGEWVVEIVAGREIPTIACRAPGGLPAKPGQEWEVTSCHPS